MMNLESVEHSNQTVTLPKSDLDELLRENKRLKAQVKFDSEIEKGYVSLIEHKPVPLNEVFKNMGLTD
jgi:hypothetical protein